MLLLLLKQVLRIGFFKGMVDGNQFLLKNGYIDDSLVSRLLVSQSLDI